MILSLVKRIYLLSQRAELGAGYLVLRFEVSRSWCQSPRHPGSFPLPVPFSLWSPWKSKLFPWLLRLSECKFQSSSNPPKAPGSFAQSQVTPLANAELNFRGLCSSWLIIQTEALCTFTLTLLDRLFIRNKEGPKACSLGNYWKCKS